MATIVGTNSYSTEDELLDYAGARGVSLLTPEDILLTKAMDWLEMQPFSGYKTDSEQALQFPRNLETVVPTDIKNAQMVAAILIDSGQDLMAIQGQRVISESIFQAVAVEYAETGRQSNFYPQLAMLLRNYLSNSGGNTFGVTRG